MRWRLIVFTTELVLLLVLPARQRRQLQLQAVELDGRQVRRVSLGSLQRWRELDVRPGDQVALARPGYVAYRNTLKALADYDKLLASQKEFTPALVNKAEIYWSIKRFRRA